MDRIDEYLDSLPDWQRTNLDLFRKLIHETAPTVVEDFKWSVPVFLLDGTMYFAMSAFKAHTKYNFIANGAYLEDKKKLFNNGHNSKKSRSIDLREGETVNITDLKELIELAVNK